MIFRKTIEIARDLGSNMLTKWQLVTGKISIQGWVKFLYKQDFFYLALESVFPDARISEWPYFILCPVSCFTVLVCYFSYETEQ